MQSGSAWLTPLLVVAVLGVVVVAALDAVRDDGPTRGTTGVRTSPGKATARVAAALARHGATGSLHYTDPECLRRSLSLPGLTIAPAQRVACEDELQPRRPVPRAGASFPDGRPRVGCRRGAVELLGGRRLLRRVRECARSGLPDGSLVLVRAGVVVVRQSGCPGDRRCERVLLTRDDLRGAARRHPNVPASPSTLSGVAAVDVAWLGGRRYAVLLEAELGGRPAGLGAQPLIAWFEGRRVVATQPFFVPGAEGVAVSPRGSFVATTGRLALFRRDASSVALARPFSEGHAVAWSPDERLTAVATRTSILVVATAELLTHADTGSAPSLVRIPVAVRELAWDARP